MMSKSLVERIDALSPDKKAEVESFVEGLERSESRMPKALPDELLDRIKARREKLFREHGLFDSLPILRELRDSGPR
jgi:hypothetical protein